MEESNFLRIEEFAKRVAPAAGIVCNKISRGEINLDILIRPDYQVLSSTWRSGRSLPCALESRGATFVHDAGAEHPLSKCTITKLRSGSQTTSATMAGSHDASHTHTGSLSLMLNAPAALIVSSASKDDPTGKMVEAGLTI